jgi:hypothetical protein
VPDFARAFPKCLFASARRAESVIPRTGRRSERSFWPAFQADYPRIFGGLLDAVAGGLRELPSVHLNELPRMADYAEWGEAVGRALGWGTERFLADYDDNRKRATDPLLEGSTVATLPFALSKLGVNWTGTTQKFYDKATIVARGHLGPDRPKSASAFGTVRRRIAPQLRVHGIAVQFERRRAGSIVSLSFENGKTGGSKPSTTDM